MILKRHSTKNNEPKIISGLGSSFFQPKLTINQPNDPDNYRDEQEADAMADKVMRMPAPSANNNFFFKPAISTIQTKCEHCEEDKKELQRKEINSDGSTAATSTENYISSLNGKGRSLSHDERGFFEPRFGYDFSNVKIHTDAVAAKSAQSVNALAYTTGNNIVFNNNKYQPATENGKRLLGHELTHIIQQQGGGTPSIQRDCSDADYCTPYPTAADAASAEALLRAVYLPADEAKFGTDSRGLYESFLSRAPGDSLSPVIFNNPANDVVDSFATSGNTADDQDAVIDLVGARLSRAPGWPLRDSVTTMMSLANFLSTAEMDRSINYSNPFSIAGHIAGGIGSSDAGPDYRKINYGNVTLEKTTLFGSTGYVSVETTLQYEVFDAVDFCPGDCGSPVEQRITIPMSRLEAGGQAYDVPFKVNFTAPSRSKIFWF